MAIKQHTLLCEANEPSSLLNHADYAHLRSQKTVQCIIKERAGTVVTIGMLFPKKREVMMKGTKLSMEEFFCCHTVLPILKFHFNPVHHQEVVPVYNAVLLQLLSRSVVSDSVRTHRQQPTRLHRPWDSPGKNTGVGCHFLLQTMKVKSESEVAHSCLTLCDPMDCSLPGSFVHRIFQARVLKWVASSSGPLLNIVLNPLVSKVQRLCNFVDYYVPNAYYTTTVCMYRINPDEEYI